MSTSPNVLAVTSKATPVDLGRGRIFYIRKLSPSVTLAKMGTIPQSFLDLAKLAGSQTFQAEAAAFERDNPDWSRNYAVSLLVSAVVAMSAVDEGEEVTNLLSIADKPLSECGPTELPLAYLDDEDQAALLNAIQIDNGLTQEAAEKEKPFLRGELLALLLRLDSAEVRDQSSGDSGMAH